MEKKFNKNLGIELPLLGFGAMRLPKTDDKIDVEATAEMIDYAFKNGVNYFDTAMPYHGGESEVVLGKILPKYDRSSYFLADKLPIYYIKEDGDAQKYLDEQLEKCGTDYFDFYLVHALSKDRVKTMEDFKLYDFCMKKKEEGTLKYVGFSYHGDVESLKYLTDNYKWDFIQLQLNYFDWQQGEAREFYEILEKHDIPCIVMEPVRGGFLSAFASHVEKPMKEYNPTSSISSWAIRWVASLPNVITVLSGMSNLEQLKDNINQMTPFAPINDEEKKILENVVVELDKIKPIPCTACKYCMPCPVNVNIAGCFSVYNNYKKTENSELAKNAYNNPFQFTKESQAHNCIKCGQCVVECPQNIDIPLELENVAKLIDGLK